MKSPPVCVILSKVLKKPRRFGGFTLVELLASMVLLALVGLMLAGALRFGARSFAAAGGGHDPDEAFLTTAALVRRLLAEAYPLATIGNNERQIQFIGDGAQLAFVGFMPEGAGVPGLAEIALIGGEGRLLLRWRPRGSTARPAERVLLAGVDARFAYWGARDLTNPPSWSNAWPVGELPPLLVRLELTGGGAGPGGAWPLIVAAPKTMLDSLVAF